MPLLDSLQTIGLKIFGYPARETLDDITDIRNKRKVVRSTWRLVTSACSAVIGGLLPYQMAPAFGNYLQGIYGSLIKSALSETLASSATLTGTITVVSSTWVMWSLGFIAAKYGLQIYYHCKYGDTNSDHIISQDVVNEIIDTYEDNLQAEYPEVTLKREDFREAVKRAVKHLVSKIKEAKKHEKDPRYKRYNLVPSPHDKQYYKAILWHLKEGNVSTFNDYCVAEDKYRRLRIATISHELELLHKHSSMLSQQKLSSQNELKFRAERAKQTQSTHANVTPQTSDPIADQISAEENKTKLDQSPPPTSVKQALTLGKTNDHAIAVTVNPDSAPDSAATASVAMVSQLKRLERTKTIQGSALAESPECISADGIRAITRQLELEKQKLEQLNAGDDGFQQLPNALTVKGV